MADQVQSLSHKVTTAISDAMGRAVPDAGAAADPLVRRSEHADFQSNAALPLAKTLKKPPREIADAIVSELTHGSQVLTSAVSGPGFINLDLTDQAMWAQMSDRLDAPRLGVSLPRSDQTTVIDYSGPNIAKEMHVGHLRTTIVGDSLARILSYLGSDVIRQNHLGDWGTQFGMLIQYVDEFGGREWRALGEDDASTAISRLDHIYRSARRVFDEDEEFARRASRRVAALQAGDADTLRTWRELVEESERSFGALYRRLGVLLTTDDSAGESSYNHLLSGVVDELMDKGIAKESDGAICVFFDDVKGPDGEPTPLIVRKADGGFGYAATDLATLRYRARDLGADRVLYVVDSRQSLHFKMVFDTADRAGWLSGGVDVEHVAFGSILGKDGRPFKTRSGDTVKLQDLLDSAVNRAHAELEGRDSNLSDRELDVIAEAAGIGAVKYADLSTSRTKDYIFDAERMVSFHGNTGVYLQYAHARVASLLRRAATSSASAPGIDTTLSLHPAERTLALCLDDFEETLQEVGHSLEPHRLCAYTYQLARNFTEFYEKCPVMRAESDAVLSNRLALCELTASTLKQALTLMGISAPDRL